MELIAVAFVDCRGIAHPDCKQLLPVPCVPIAVTPGGTKHNEVGLH